MDGHNQIRDELAKQLKHSHIEYGRIDTEFHVNPPRSIGTGRIDVVWRFNGDKKAEGVAFEIKTRLPNQSKTHVRMDGVRQLHRCALCGYYPVLVSSRDVYSDTSGAIYSMKRLIRALGASYLEVSAHPLRFSLAQDNIPSKIDIPDCLQ